ncbi:MAG: carboxypeptidase-like regulatory domain-containing protein [Thermoanaerobaculales bacterium]|jgi:protocatechuate 3,4-dioxygenase beta subunit|nr:carboxypeptidase-like regulatory domain-containing protein [Thermoanaerobaculales bacterium]
MMKRRVPRRSAVVLCGLLLASTVGVAADAGEEEVAARLVEVGLAIDRQIELAQANDERGTLDPGVLQRQADAAARELRSLERRINALPETAREELLTKLRAIEGQAANLARTAELGSAPPRRSGHSERVAHLERRFNGLRQAPANDDCENAFSVGIGTYAGETNDATNDGEAQCGASLSSPDVWYRFVAPDDGWLIAETTYSMFDTVLSVHSECPGTMANQIVCDDDSVGLAARVRFHVWQSEEYLVRVSGSNGASGIYQLAFSYGGAIEGTVTDTQAGAPVSTYVWAYDGDGHTVAGAPTDAAGFYSVDGLGTGDYFVATDNYDDAVDEVYDDHPCPGGPGNGCDPTIGDPVSVTIGDVVQGIDFVLDRSGVISGTVTDEDSGLGIYDVDVYLYDDSGTYVDWEYTDASGEYRFAGLEAGSYLLWATAPTHLDELYDDVPCTGGPGQGCVIGDGTPVLAQLNAITEGIDFQLDRLGAIAGTVVDRSTGLPISWSDIDVWDQSGSWVKDGRSAQDGTYEIGGLPDGSYVVTASKYSDYVDQLYDGIDCPPEGCDIPAGTPVVVAGQATTAGIDFDLVERGRIEGQLVDESTGLPVQGVRCRVYDDSGVYWGYGYSNHLGSYVADELFAGTYFVVAEDGDYHNELYDDLPCRDGCDPTTGTPIAVADGTATTGVDFSLVPKAIITGTVTAEDGGFPVDMRMLLFDATGSHILSDDSSSGVYRFSGIDDGQYYVVASRGYSSDPYLGELFDDIPCWLDPPEGCVVTDGAPVSATSGSTTTGIDFSLLRAGSIQGVVTDAVTQEPVGGGVVAIRVAPLDWLNQWESLGSDGAYHFDGLLPGEYVVALDLWNHRGEVWDDHPCVSEYPDGCDLLGGTPIEIAVASEVAGINFSVDRLGELGGTVRAATSGLALPGISAEVFDDQGEYVTSCGADEQGRYHVDGLWPGDYFVATNHYDLGLVNQLFDGIDCPQGPFYGCDVTTGTPVPVGLNSSNRWVDFELPPAGAISGRVTDEETSLPLGDVRVTVWDESGNERAEDRTDADGVYSIAGLESGDFFVATGWHGTSNPDYIDQLYDGIPCPNGPPWGCDPTKGTPVGVVGGSSTGGIDLALPRRMGGIQGMVTGLPAGDPVAGVQIDVWSAGGGYEGGSLTSPAGTYVIDLDPGDYVVATDNPGAWINQIWDGIVCPTGSAYGGDCDPMTGGTVTVTYGELTESVDFVLSPTFSVFADGFESGTTTAWSSTVQ